MLLIGLGYYRESDVERDYAMFLLRAVIKITFFNKRYAVL